MKFSTSDTVGSTILLSNNYSNIYSMVSTVSYLFVYCNFTFTNNWLKEAFKKVATLVSVLDFLPNSQKVVSKSELNWDRKSALIGYILSLFELGTFCKHY